MRREKEDLMRYQTVQIQPSQGGDLATRISHENVGAANYVTKRDWRRAMDGETRREGDVGFIPDTTGELIAQAAPTTDPITLVHYARKPNGKATVIVGTDTALFRYFRYEDGAIYEDAYEDAYEDVSAPWIQIGTFTAGHRWEAVDVGGYTVFNNGVDLPYYYDLSDFVAWPIYELREQGVACVETISEYNGCLFCAGISYLPDSALDTTGYSVHPGDDTIRYQVLWSDSSTPLNFAAGYSDPNSGSLTAGSRDLIMAGPHLSIQQGDELLISGAGENGGVLTATVLWVKDATTLVLDEVGVVTNTNATVTKATSVSSIAGSFDLQDDNAPIYRMMELQGRLVVFKEGSIFLGTATGDAELPFNFQIVYTGHRTPYWRWMMSRMNGTEIIYAGRNAFYTFSLSSQSPQEHRKLELCKNIFFDVADRALLEDYYAADNDITKEIWFCFPDGTSTDQALAYDYQHNTCASIAARYTAAATTRRPINGVVDGNEETWFVLGTHTGDLRVYGLSDLASATYQRSGANYDSTLKSGLVSFGDDFNEKDLRTLLVQFGTGSVAPASVTLYGVRNATETPSALFTKIIATPTNHVLIPCFYRKQYFQDQIVVTGVSTNAVVARKIYEALARDSQSITRNVTS